MLLLFLSFVVFNCVSGTSSSSWGGLYPRESATREVKSLDGIWNFRRAPLLKPNQGFDEEWFKKPLKKVIIP